MSKCAAEVELNTHMDMLNTLHATNMISLDMYVEKKAMVQSKYYHQVEANELLSSLLKENS